MWAAENVFPALNTSETLIQLTEAFHEMNSNSHNRLTFSVEHCSFCDLHSRCPDKMSWLGSTNAQSSLHCTTCGPTPEYWIHGLYCQNSCWSVDAVGIAHMLTLWSVHTEGNDSRKCPCFKKCIFRETAWAALWTGIAGIMISADLKSFSGLWQNRGKHS